MKTLYLVRHGRTVFSDDGFIAGSTDVALSEAGKRETAALAGSGLPKFSHCYCSDLQRARQSSDLLTAQTPIVDARVRELNFGDWEQRTWTDVHNEDSQHLTQWSEDWVNQSPPGGETFSQLAKRCEHWLTDISLSSVTGNLLVTAHGGSIRALLCVALDLPLSVAMSFSIDYSSVTVIQLGKNGNRCLVVNSTVFPRQV